MKLVKNSYSTNNNSTMKTRLNNNYKRIVTSFLGLSPI